MTRLAAVLCLCAASAAAEEYYPAEIEIAPIGRANWTDGMFDRVWIERDPDAKAIHRLGFHNHEAQTSRRGNYTVSVDGVTVDLFIDVGDGELMQVTPRGSYMAVPTEITVLDGETGFVAVMPAAF